MPLHPLKSAAGFTYIAALAIVMIMGIMMGVAGQSWKMIMAREREEELLWVGAQYRNAMLRWRTPPAGLTRNQPLSDLKQLLADPRSPRSFRYLRKLYLDPITGKEFTILKDPNKGITGVASTSEKEPIKQANFPKDFALFEGKKKYTDWQFVWDRDLSRPPTPAPGPQPLGPPR